MVARMGRAAAAMMATAVVAMTAVVPPGVFVRYRGGRLRRCDHWSERRILHRGRRLAQHRRNERGARSHGPRRRKRHRLGAAATGDRRRASNHVSARDSVRGARVHPAAVGQNQGEQERNGQLEHVHARTLPREGRASSTAALRAQETRESMLANETPATGLQGSGRVQSRRVSASSRPADNAHARRSQAS